METTPVPAELGHMHQLPPTHDTMACARWWQGLAAQPSPAWIHEEIGQRMQDRLQWIKLQPRDWIHAQPSIGGWAAHRLIAARYPQAACQVVEPSARRMAWAQAQLKPPLWRSWFQGPAKLQWLLAEAQTQSADMLWANMQLHLHADPQALLRQWHQALRVDGFLMFSCLGPDALRELHQLYQDMGWPVPGAQWTDMHDWGDMLVQTGFAEPVMDMERITLKYASPEKLIEDLRAMGRNFHPKRHPTCRGKSWADQLTRALRDRWPHRCADGQFALTLEIVYGHALKSKSRHAVDTTTSISLDEMKGMLRPK